MTYEEALKYIHSTSNFFCKPGLDRIRELCLGLGNPQNDLKFIHVGGTNGKGSFCAMTDSILRAAGYKVGLYTSPYVREFNERMRVDGRNISNDDLARLTERVKAVADKMTDRPTEFELITAIAFEYFKEEGCQVVILEVGMGGRLDATNIIGTPLLSVITGIAIDHTAFLGDTIEQIASEKAGIIKQNSVALYGGEDAVAERIIREEADKKQTLLCKTDYSKLKIQKIDLGGTEFDYKSRRGLKLSLLGAYQPKNACTVLDAIDNLSGIGLKVSEEAVKRGLAEAKWPARFEIIGEKPTVIFDGAHNPQGIRAAVDSIKDYFGNQKVVVMTGVLRDKDYLEVAKSISEISDCAFTITPSNPRALSAEEYAAVLGGEGVNARACSSVSEALELGISAASDSDTALCCLGSLYTYCEIFRLSENKPYR
ncbi:MAG: bifunctional folylpolyglutamate synthase/dihydrofolate synthase [Clostridia bacterium]|nr:bifunctional folylpolyglutamate synthase/dihydrofolate synthase [Clostridia bacterium]